MFITINRYLKTLVPFLFFWYNTFGNEMQINIGGDHVLRVPEEGEAGGLIHSRC